MELRKELGFLDVFAIASGAMISSGIFILPGLAFAKAGPSVFISYFVAGLLALTGAFNVAELASAMPRAGGDYFFITRSMGPLVGTVSGLLSWFALSLKTAFAIIGIAEILTILFHFSGVGFLTTAIIGIIIFMVLNIVGVKEAGFFEVIIVMGLLSIMGLYVIVGMPNVEVMQFENFAPNGFNYTLITAGFVFVSYGGLLKIASISEEINNPKRNIPLGLFASLGVVTIMYSLILIVTVGVLEPVQLGGNPELGIAPSITPIADAARTFAGKAGFIILTVAAMLAFISTGNAGILSASRYPFALSRDNLMPDIVSKISSRLKTPVYSIIITGIFIYLAILYLPLEILVKAASTVVILTYILSNLSIIILRESKVQNYRPSFKSPLYPWIQIIGIVAFIALIYDMGWQAMSISIALIVLGVVFFFAYGKRRSCGESALLHLVSRISNKRIRINGNLEEELREILSERDEVIFDRFDKLISDAPVVDTNGPMSVEEMFNVISHVFEEKGYGNTCNIYNLLKEREDTTSTALSQFVAVPHLIVDGTENFHILLLRCKNGVYFSEIYPKIQAIFVLAGSPDERNFHLQALAAIAQIVNNTNFEQQWLAAKSDRNLKDIILLGERFRHS